MIDTNNNRREKKLVSRQTYDEHTAVHDREPVNFKFLCKERVLVELHADEEKETERKQRIDRLIVDENK